MIEIAGLPFNGVFVCLKMFPITDHAAHGLVSRERKKRMQMIGHQQKERDVPALSEFVEPGRVEQSLRKRRFSQRLLFFLAINCDADMKQGSWLDPVRHFVVKLCRKAAIKHSCLNCE